MNPSKTNKIAILFFAVIALDSGCDPQYIRDNDDDIEDTDTQDTSDSDVDSDSDTDTEKDNEIELPFILSNIAIDDIDITPIDILFEGSDCADNANIDTGYCTADCLKNFPCAILKQSDDSEVAVVVAKKFKIADNVRLEVKGQRPLIIVSEQEAHIEGTIHAIDYIYNDSGRVGGYSCTSDSGSHDGGGPGGGESSPGRESAGGGGYCGVGGKGGEPLLKNYSAAAGGDSYGSSEIIPLKGGSSGAKNGPSSGGAGGGAIQIVSGVEIVISDIGAVNMSGNLGEANAGNGGGAGGAILLEAPKVVVAGVLAANGGSGGGGSLYGDGEPGNASDEPALGGQQSDYSKGGNGAAGNLIDGSAGEAQIDDRDSAGGGGGAAGWIRINTIDGKADITGIVSPSLGTKCTSIGTVKPR